MFRTRIEVTAALFALGILAASVHGAPPAKAAKTDKDRIQGTWVLVAGKHNGTDIPEEEIKKARNGGNRLVITGDKITFTGPGGRDRVSAYKLDPTRDPKVIEVTPQDGPARGKKSFGLYRLEDDTLKLCLNNRGVQTEAPKAFTAKAGSGLTVLTFKREKEPKEKGK